MPSEAKEADKVRQADKDIAAEYMRRFPDLRLPEAFARHREEAEKRAAAGPWMKVGTFEPISDALYLVQGTLRLSVKLGRDIDADNICAALIDDHHSGEQ